MLAPTSVEPSNVRFAAKGVDAAARYADVAEQKLDDAHGAAVLGAVGVLRLTEGVEDGARLVGTAGGGEDLPDLLHDVGIHAGDARDELGRVAGIVTLHDVEDAVRILKGHVALEDLEVRRLELRCPDELTQAKAEPSEVSQTALCSTS